jgi:carbon-monoxide dehydrogenase medium subunit
MKPPPFSYHAPSTVDEALRVLHEFGDDGKPLAGGQSLVPMLALRLTRFAHLVDLNDVHELSFVQRENGTVRIGAMTRQARVERDPLVHDHVQLLARATPLIGHFQIRNRGTIGGSIAHADPASEYPAVCQTLGAIMEVSRLGGSRLVAAADFFQSTWSADIGDEELLTAISFPVWDGRSGFAINEVARRHGDFAIAGACCAVSLDDDDRAIRAGISLFGVGSTPIDAEAAEAALLGRQVSEIDTHELGRLAAATLDPPDDLHGTASYRRAVAAVLVGRTLARALEEASRA